MGAVCPRRPITKLRLGVVCVTEVRITDQESADCIEALWHDAFRLHPIDVVCTLLRVSGLQDAGWDPFQESEAAFKSRVSQCVWERGYRIRGWD